MQQSYLIFRYLYQTKDQYQIKDQYRTKIDMVRKKLNIDHFWAKSLGNVGVLGLFLYWNVKVWSFLAQYQHTPLNWKNVKSFSVLQSFRVFSHLQKQEKKRTRIVIWFLSHTFTLKLSKLWKDWVTWLFGHFLCIKVLVTYER